MLANIICGFALVALKYFVYNVFIVDYALQLICSYECSHRLCFCFGRLEFCCSSCAFYSVHFLHILLYVAVADNYRYCRKSIFAYLCVCLCTIDVKMMSTVDVSWFSEFRMEDMRHELGCMIRQLDKWTVWGSKYQLSLSGI